MILKLSSKDIFAMWLNHMVQVHQNRAWDDSPTAEDEEREEFLNGLWGQLSELDRQRIWGLSADLQSENRQQHAPDSCTITSDALLVTEQSDAFRNRDWERLLKSLRRKPEFWTQQELAYLRAVAWLQLGQPEIAKMFLNRAFELESDNPKYIQLELRCFFQLGDWEAASARATQLIQKPQTSPSLLFHCGFIFRMCAEFGDVQANLKSAIAAVDLGFERLPKPLLPSAAAPFLSVAFLTKSRALQDLGVVSEAIDVLNEGIMLITDDPMLLVARGALRNDNDHSAAIEDFRKAAKLGVAISWPFVELARDAILRREFDEALDFATHGLRLKGPATTRAQLLEVAAVAMFGIGTPLKHVRDAFAEAIQLDPLNQCIVSNLRAVEARQLKPEVGNRWEFAPIDSEHEMTGVYESLYSIAE